MQDERQAAAGLPDPRGMDRQELEAFARSEGQPAYRGRQLFRWIQGRAATDFESMTDLPAGWRASLAGRIPLEPAEVVRRQVDPEDGTVKLLLRLRDGELVETVRMRYRYGTSACISTQAGCNVGCRFCASTLGGKRRDLTAGEMAEQALAIQRELLPHGERLSRLVLMGMGEPLENYEETVRFLRLAHEPEGMAISYRRMTVSTSGVAPAIERLAGEGLPVTLAISLHAPNDELRRRLVPMNNRYPLARLLEAARSYLERTGRRLTFEYVLIDRVNDEPEHARELAALLHGLLCHVNLIPLNESGRGLVSSPPERIEAFRRVLERSGLQVTVRRSLGQQIDAACGQLRRREVAGGERRRAPLPR
ncbi:MAG: 23S rRNA (adenine(2503)-C(2))-methyltransferase RlmN [Bacillota bacterium]|nr:23S rRNA (adenine(2503)-C(2))-methyltransferase RlmN [Bacillota bacterium]